MVEAGPGGSWAEWFVLSADRPTDRTRSRVGMSAAEDGRRPSLGLVEERMDKETDSCQENDW